MADPLAEVVSLLQPSVRVAKLASGSGRWRVCRSDLGNPFYCLVLEGESRLCVESNERMVLRAGDFVLIPAAFNFTMSSLDVPKGKGETEHFILPNGEVRHGSMEGPPDVRMLVGHCTFASPDADLLVALLPKVVRVRGEPRMIVLVELVRDEFRQNRPARRVILSHLLEILFIEALRSSSETTAPPGLVRGLHDERLAGALRCIHENPTAPWTVAELAKEAGLSRSAFFERFSQAMGVTPIEYLSSWRMALAKDLLRRKTLSIAEIAEQVGYGSASAFSVAFARHVGVPPGDYARKQRNAIDALT